LLYRTSVLELGTTGDIGIGGKDALKAKSTALLWGEGSSGMKSLKSLGFMKISLSSASASGMEGITPAENMNEFIIGIVGRLPNGGRSRD